MTTIWKLTTQDWYTRKDRYNATKWGPGVTHTASGKGDLCGPGWIHGYTDPLLAVLLNPIHADISDPVLWQCEASGECKTGQGLKVGYTSVTTLEVVTLPAMTTEQRVKFAILCALEVYGAPEFVAWADKWLSGKDRAAVSAAEAARAAEAAAKAAVSAEAAAWAAVSAAEAAEAAAEAAEAAPRGNNSIDFIALAHKAVS